MDTRSDRAKEIFIAALEIQDSSEQTVYIKKQCGDDENLLSEVQYLLSHHNQVGDFLERPVLDPECTLDESPITEGPGTVIGRYKLLEQIGEGGFGVVYMAQQKEPVRRKVALKIIKLGMDTKAVIARFEAERQALAMMDHHHIAKVLDGGATDTGRPYFVMELVQGVSITDFCDSNNLATQDRLNLFAKTCAAVQHAHSKGVIHRDIKPTNVLVTMEDDKPIPKVIDFGIAKATDQHLTERTLFTGFKQFVGTPQYMSPEQAQMSGIDIDTRSDVYSLGVLLYELLTGTTPVDAKTLREAGYEQMCKMIREDEALRPSMRISTLGEKLTEVAQSRQVEPPKLGKLVRGDLDWIVMKALEKDRVRRYETPNALADDIARHLKDEPVVAGPPSTAYRLHKFARRHRVTVTAAAAVAVVMLIGVIGLSIGNVMLTQKEAETREALEVAENHSNQAEANFALAVAAVDKMLAEVGGDTLAHVPRMERVRRQLLVEAADFYDQFMKNEGNSPEIHFEAGKAFRNLGIIRAMLGEHAEAEASFNRAIEIFNQLAMASPDSTQHQVALVESHLAYGELLEMTGRFDDAEQAFARAIEISESLNQNAQASLDDQSTLADGYSHMGMLYDKVGRFSEADTVYRKGIAIDEHIIQNAPENQKLAYQSAQNIRRFGDFLRWSQFYHAPGNQRKGLLESAEEYFNQALKIFVALNNQSPGNSDYIYELSITHIGIAGAVQELGRTEYSQRLLIHRAQLLEQLAEDYPDVIRYRRDLSHSYLYVESKSRSLNDEAKKIAQDLVEEYPDIPNYRHQLALAIHYGSSSTDTPEQKINDQLQAAKIWEGLAAEFPQVVNYHLYLDWARDWARKSMMEEKWYQEAADLSRQRLPNLDHMIERIPNSPLWHIRKSWAMNGLSQAMNMLGEHDQAIEVAEQNLLDLKKAASLVDVPDDVLAGFADVQIELIKCLIDAGQIQKAQEILSKGPYESLASIDSGNSKGVWERKHHAVIQVRLAESHNLAGNLDEANKAWKIAGELYRQLLSEDATNPVFREAVRKVYAQLGDGLKKAGKLDEDIEAWQRTMELLTENPDPKLEPKKPKEDGALRLEDPEWGRFTFRLARKPETKLEREMKDVVKSFDLSAKLKKAGRLAEADKVAKELSVVMKGWGKQTGLSDKENRLQASIQVRWGDFNHLAGQLDEAIRAWQTSIDLNKKLLINDPVNKETLRNLTFASRKLGEGLSETERVDEAIEIWRWRIEVIGKLMVADPEVIENRNRLMESYGFLSDGLRKTGHPAEADEISEEIVGIMAKWREQPFISISEATVLAGIQGRWGDSRKLAGQLDVAIEAWRLSTDLYSKLRSVRPEDIDLCEKASWAYKRLGEGLSEVGHVDEAIEAWQAANKMYQEMILIKPTKENYRNDLMYNYVLIGDALNKAGRVDEAIEAWTTDYELSLKFHNEYPENKNYRNRMIWSIEKLGTQLSKAGRMDGAIELWQHEMMLQKQFLNEQLNTKNRNFADAVLKWNASHSGGAVPTGRNAIIPANTLGPPDVTSGRYGPGDPGTLALGSGGLLEVLFTDNQLTTSGDDSDDLLIFEVGPDAEDTFIAVRPTPETLPLLNPKDDANNDGFFEIGKVSGGASSIDIDRVFSGFDAGELRFNAVQLIDDPRDGDKRSGHTVGADIDAIEAIASISVAVANDLIQQRNVAQKICEIGYRFWDHGEESLAREAWAMGRDILLKAASLGLDDPVVQSRIAGSFSRAISEIRIRGDLDTAEAILRDSMVLHKKISLIESERQTQVRDIGLISDQQALAALQVAKGQYPEAEKALRYLLALDRKSRLNRDNIQPPIRQQRNLVSVLRMAGRKDEGIAAWRQLLEIEEEWNAYSKKFPSAKGKNRGVYIFLVPTATQAGYLGLHQEGQDLFLRFLDSYLADSEGWGQLKTSYQKSGGLFLARWALLLLSSPNPDELLSQGVVARMQQVVALHKRDAHCLWALGIAQYLAGRYGEATESLEAALENCGMPDGDGVYLFALAMAHSKSGDEPTAQQYYDAGASWLSKQNGTTITQLDLLKQDHYNFIFGDMELDLVGRLKREAEEAMGMTDPLTAKK